MLKIGQFPIGYQFKEEIYPKEVIMTVIGYDSLHHSYRIRWVEHDGKVAVGPYYSHEYIATKEPVDKNYKLLYGV
jgi:hypothetical protein